jgi:TRAP-type transport system periplasmic protein
MRFVGLTSKVFVLVLAACLVVPAVASAKGLDLTFSDLFPATHPNGKMIISWGKDVEKATEGRVKLTYYPGQSLTKARECYDGVVNGLSDMGQGICQYTRGRFPLTDFINLPVGIPSGKVATAVLNEYYEKFKPKELADVKVMYMHAHGPGLIHTIKGKKLGTMADLKGLKLRGHGGPTTDMLKALGATPLAFPMPELYQSLQKGVVDGAVYPFEADKGWKLADVSKNVAVAKKVAYSIAFFVIMSNDKWNKISPADQKAIEAINLEYIKKQGVLWDKMDETGMAFFKEKGGTVVEISGAEEQKWVDAVQPVIQGYVKKATAAGLPGDKVMEFALGRFKAAAEGKFESKYLGK